MGDVNLSIYGRESCGIKVIECEDIHIIYDFLLYEGWKSYASKRIGTHVHDFNLNFSDGSSSTVAIYLLTVPNMIIYAFKNSNPYGIDISTEIFGMSNKEIVGPEGKVSFNQHFKIDANGHDVFILRDTEKFTLDDNQNLSFKMKSITGTKYESNQPRGKNVIKVYEFLYNDVPEASLCIVNKIPQLKMAQLYNDKGEEILDMTNQEIKVKRKSVIQAAKFDRDNEVFEDDDQEIINAIKNAGVPGATQDQQVKYVLKTPDGQFVMPEQAKVSPQEQQSIDAEKEKKLEKLKQINLQVEEEKSRRDNFERANLQESKSTNIERNKSNLKFKEEPELLKTDGKLRSKSAARPKKSILKNKVDEQPDKNDDLLKMERNEAL